MPAECSTDCSLILSLELLAALLFKITAFSSRFSTALQQCFFWMCFPQFSFVLLYPLPLMLGP